MDTHRASVSTATAPMLLPGHAPGSPPGPREETRPASPPAAAPLPAGAPSVSVVIPARNEARNLPGLLAELPAGLHEVILVDGASEDATIAAARLARPDILVLRQTGRGKGNALACGILACTGQITVTLDADGSADPAEIAEFVAALVAGADFVKGSRFLPGGGSSDLTRLRRLGNGALLLAMNRLYGTAFSDLCYGYNAFWTRCADELDLGPLAEAAPCFGDGFEIETLLTAHAATARLTMAEVPSYERERRFGESHLNTWRDGRRVLRAIVRERLRAPARAPETRPARPIAVPETAGKSPS
jgi:glycosyltransferase involved in cell wall biosynthesis